MLFLITYVLQLLWNLASFSEQLASKLVIRHQVCRSTNAEGSNKDLPQSSHQLNQAYQYIAAQPWFSIEMHANAFSDRDPPPTPPSRSNLVSRFDVLAPWYFYNQITKTKKCKHFNYIWSSTWNWDRFDLEGKGCQWLLQPATVRPQYYYFHEPMFQHFWHLNIISHSITTLLWIV